MLLAKLGFEVEAVTGKAEQGDWLRQIGASAVLGREAVQEGTAKALLKERWAGAVDTVGGDVLFNVSSRCAVAAASPAVPDGGHRLPGQRVPLHPAWRELAGGGFGGNPAGGQGRYLAQAGRAVEAGRLERLCHEVGLAELPAEIARILEGRQVGRALVRVD